MDKEKIISLTNQLYKLTLLFPKKEPLRYKMRELGDEILLEIIKMNSLANSPNPSKKTEVSEEEIISNLDILDSFFDVAKEQNWLSLSDLELLQKEYNALKIELENQRVKKITSQPPLVLKEREAEKIEENNLSPSQDLAQKEKEGPGSKTEIEIETRKSLNERQEKILTFLKEQGRAQVWQVKQILPEVTKRTLRRDFDNLLKKGMIERIGERNNTFYQIKKSY